MAADLHIHSVAIRDLNADGTPKIDEITEDDLRCFNHTTLGSKFLDFSYHCTKTVSESMYCEHDDRILKSDSAWIGEVSWLKAVLFDDSSYVPDVVRTVRDLIGEELPVLDTKLTGKILRAIELTPSTGMYEVLTTNRSEYADLVDFLNRNRDERLFVVSW